MNIDISHIVWPVTVIIIILVLKKDISLFASRVKKGKLFGQELELQDSILPQSNKELNNGSNIPKNQENKNNLIKLILAGVIDCKNEIVMFLLSYLTVISLSMYIIVYHYFSITASSLLLTSIILYFGYLFLLYTDDSLFMPKIQTIVVFSLNYTKLNFV